MWNAMERLTVTTIKGGGNALGQRKKKGCSHLENVHELLLQVGFVKAKGTGDGSRR